MNKVIIIIIIIYYYHGNVSHETYTGNESVNMDIVTSSLLTEKEMDNKK